MIKLHHGFVIHIIKCLKNEIPLEDVEKAIKQLQGKVEACKDKIKRKDTNGRIGPGIID